MQIENLTIVLQTVRLPNGSEQFVVPVGSSISRDQLIAELNRSPVEASHEVMQPITGRGGTERLSVLRTHRLTKTQEEDLRAWLQDKLRFVPDVIDEHSTKSDIPTSEILSRWQDEIRNRFSVKSLSINWGIVAMFGFGLIAIASFLFWLLPIGNQLPINGAMKVGVDDQSLTKRILEKWNIIKGKRVEKESDLLKLISPLVVHAPEQSDQAQLIQVLQSINQSRLGNFSDAKSGELESTDDRLWELLSNDALNSYVRKLISEDGKVNRFGLVASNANLDSLKQLLPASADENIASTYRQLVRQLIGVAPIGQEGKRLLDEDGPSFIDGPFFDFFEPDLRKEFDLMAQSIPVSFRNGTSPCTYFTEDDCKAALKIKIFFSRIEFLDNQGLGFPSNAERRKRLQTNASRVFVILLNDWKRFADGKLDNPPPNPHIDAKLPETKIP